MNHGNQRNGLIFKPNDILLAETRTRIYTFRHELVRKKSLIDFSKIDQPGRPETTYMYAPPPDQLNKIAYYMEVKKEYFKTMFSEIAWELPSVFVSVSLVRAFADAENGDVENGDGENGHNWLQVLLDGHTHAKEDLSWLKGEPRWRDHLEYYRPIIPVRAPTGQVLKATLPVLEASHQIFDRKGWKTWFKKQFSIPASKGAPARCTDFNLSFPLLIWPIKFSQVKNPLEDHGYEVLEVCVEEVNKENKENKKNKGTANWEVKMAESNPPQDYKLLSTDPFGIFLTFIHNKDWNNWMTTSGLGQPVIRNFIVGETDKLGAVMSGIDEEINKIHEALSPEAQMQLTKAEQKRAKTYAELRYKHDAVNNGTIEYGDSGVTMHVYLDAEKIENAKGKRDQEQDQKRVMGKVSAPEIAKSLGWPEEMLRFTNAEWLHLAGFAYGGFLIPEEENSWSTSQVPYNLVFGTSETNSLMTRYEIAFQQLMRKESKLRELEHAAENVALTEGLPKPEFHPPTGWLKIKTNDPEVELEYDQYDGVQYSTAKCRPWSEVMKTQSFRQANQEVSIAAMRKIAEDFFFVAHTIKYSFEFSDNSRILLRPPFEQTTHFYPFMRPLLHKAEVALDKKLMSYLYRFAKQELALQRADLFGYHDVDFDDPEIGEKKTKVRGTGGKIEYKKGGQQQKEIRNLDLAEGSDSDIEEEADG